MFPSLLGCVLSSIFAPFIAVGQKGRMTPVCTLTNFYIKPYASYRSEIMHCINIVENSLI